jgi:hypothetical protein
MPIDYEEMVRQRAAERDTTLRELKIEETVPSQKAKTTLREKVELAEEPENKPTEEKK